jgi:Torus domain/Nuclear fragile X mental retardation-interacting protein 1 (NUFIP1)
VSLSQHRTSTQPVDRSAQKEADGGSRKMKSGTTAAGFQTVTVQAPGCPVQHFRICVGNDPDDIRKWIQERKRRFPRQKKLNDLLGAYGDSSSEDESEEREQDAPATVSFSLTALHEGKNTDLIASPAVSAVLPKASDPKRALVPIEASGTTNSTNKRRKLLCRYFANGHCASGVNCSFSHETPPVTLAQPKSLVGKLLEQERRREAALTLQLLYMLHNEFDYFQHYGSSEANAKIT